MFKYSSLHTQEMTRNSALHQLYIKDEPTLQEVIIAFAEDVTRSTPIRANELATLLEDSGARAYVVDNIRETLELESGKLSRNQTRTSYAHAAQYLAQHQLGLERNECAAIMNRKYA